MMTKFADSVGQSQALISHVCCLKLLWHHLTLINFWHHMVCKPTVLNKNYLHFTHYKYKFILLYSFFQISIHLFFISQTMLRSTVTSPAVNKMNRNTMSSCWHATAPCSPSTWLWYNVLNLLVWCRSVNSPGVVVTKQIPSVSYLLPLWKLIDAGYLLHIHIW